jgi:hypothetical protein
MPELVQTTPIRSHRDLERDQRAVDAAIEIIQAPLVVSERRDVFVNEPTTPLIAIGRRRRGGGVAADAEAEAAEAQVCSRVRYPHFTATLDRSDEGPLRTIVGMITHSDRWLIRPR